MTKAKQTVDACPKCGNRVYKNLIGLEDPVIYDGVAAWECIDCGTIFPRKGFEDVINHFQGLKEHYRITTDKLMDEAVKERDALDKKAQEEEDSFRMQKAVEAAKEVIETNAKGGMNSKIQGRFDLLPPVAIERLAMVLEEGATKYADNNWRKVDIQDHINHALRHLMLFMRPTVNHEEHLTHAFTRLAMATELYFDGSV